MCSDETNNSGAAGDLDEPDIEETEPATVEPPADAGPDDSPLPVWCAHVFIIDSVFPVLRGFLVACGLVAYLGGWFWLPPVASLLALFYIVLTALAMWYTLRANAALLKVRSEGVVLAFRAMCLVAIETGLMLWCVYAERAGRTEHFSLASLLPLAVLAALSRFVYHALYAAALVRVRPILNQAAPPPGGAVT